MTPIHVVLDGAATPLWQSLVTALSPAVVAALAALGGVALTNRTIISHRREDNRQRAIDRQYSTELQDAEYRRDRGLAALALSEHLEDFVMSCMRVVISFSNVVWSSPYTPDERIGIEPEYLKPMPEWPSLVDWRRLDLATAVSASNFKRRVQLHRESLSDAAILECPEEHHADEADYAAELGLEAWALAAKVRRENHLETFEWPKGWIGADVFHEHIAKRDKIKAQQAKSAIAF